MTDPDSTDPFSDPRAPSPAEDDWFDAGPDASAEPSSRGEEASAPYAADEDQGEVTELGIDIAALMASENERDAGSSELPASDDRKPLSEHDWDEPPSASAASGLAPSDQAHDGEDADLSSLLDQAISGTETQQQTIHFDLDVFLREPGFRESLLQWLAGIAPEDRPTTTRAACRMLHRDIARIDRLLNQQVNAILHHPQFQRLEASWRGVAFLVHQMDGLQNIRVRVLNVTFRELVRDLDRAVEFDQSQFFKRVYEDEFGTAGGEPFGMLVGDYEFRHRISADHPTDDVRVLEQISHVAAASFAPFVAAASPEFFGVDSYSDLQRPINLSRIFEQTEYLKWRTFRETEDARFVGLVMPRVQMRRPYRDGDGRTDRFPFVEEYSVPKSNRVNDVRDGLRRGCLWGNAAYAFAAVVMRAFAETRWFADIRGTQRGDTGGGLVMDLLADSYGTDREGIAQKASVDFVVSEDREKEFSELGFIVLCPCKDTAFSVFYSNASCQKPKKYDNLAATINARLSSMLQYMFCVARFSHYIKIMGRDKIGTLAEVEECERFLHKWLHRYVTDDDNASTESKSRFPLREASVEIKEMPGKPGSYLCVTHLRPHFQLDDLKASVRLFTEIAPPGAN